MALWDEGLVKCVCCGMVMADENYKGHLENCTMKRQAQSLRKELKAVVVKPHEYIGPHYFNNTQEDWDL